MNEHGGAVERWESSIQLELTGDPAVDAVLADYARATAAVNALDLTPLVRLDVPSTGLHAAARNLELLRRATQVFDSRYIAAVEVGGEPARYAQPSTAVFLREQLRLTRTEARRRVDLAHAVNPAVSLVGETLPAPLPVLAAAVTAGVVSADHARTIIETIHRLPTQVRAESGPVVEAEMVEAAGKVTPADLEGLATEVLVRADPDGTLRDVDYAHANRGLRLSKNRGRPGGKLVADLDAETYELCRTVIDARSKPVPAVPASNDATGLGPDEGVAADPEALAWAVQDGVQQSSDEFGTRDGRSLAERQHDGLTDILKLVLNSGDLPASGGTPASVVWHITDQQLHDQYGLAVSEHGTLIPVPDALRAADQGHLYVLIENAKGIPLHLARTARIATPGQTIALAARDRGCSFPGCDRPPAHCQRHHITDWVHGGNTDITNLTLLCGHHHRSFAKAGWDCVMIDGHPHWRPPAWLDPNRRPIRNTHHYPCPTPASSDSGTVRQ